MAFGGLNIWRFDAWAGHTRTDDELKTAQRGPSPAVYLNRFGDVDVRAFGPFLPLRSRKIASTLLRCHRLAPSGGARRVTRAARRVPTGLKKLPADIVATKIFPFLVEDDDLDDGSTEATLAKIERLHNAECFMGKLLRLDDAIDSWSEGERHAGWCKFIYDFAGSFDQTIPMHAIYIIHTLWWRLNEDGEAADDMLREVQQRFNTLDLSESSLLLCAGALELAITLHGKPFTEDFSRIFRHSQPLDVAEVGDYIHSRIGWRVMVPTADSLLAHCYHMAPTYEPHVTYFHADEATSHGASLIAAQMNRRRTQENVQLRCNAVARIVATNELAYPYPPSLLAAAILCHVRRTMRIEPAWTPTLTTIMMYREAQFAQLERDLARWVPDPANAQWPWAGVGGDDSDDADY